MLHVADVAMLESTAFKANYWHWVDKQYYMDGICDTIEVLEPRFQANLDTNLTYTTPSRLGKFLRASEHLGEIFIDHFAKTSGLSKFEINRYR